jgi:hypothetical protein
MDRATPRALAGVSALLAVLLIMLGSWSGVSEARTDYDHAVDRFGEARAGYRSSFDDFLLVRRNARTQHELAGELSRLDLGPFAHDETASVFAEAAAALGSFSSGAITDGAVTVPRSTDSLWPPALHEASSDLESGARDLAERSGRLDELSEDVRVAMDRVETAVDELAASVAASASGIEEANVSARNADRIAFARAADVLLERIGRWDDETTAHLALYVAAAQRLSVSHEAEEQEKSGALYVQRKEVEAFARSIAGGVLLEFDWAPVVNGFGQGESYGGLATATTQDQPQAAITLSDSIARDWPWSDIGRAVVVHEVGHAMTSKCWTIFNPATTADHEAWATAWAIGMGADGNGSGESLYGRPPAELIARSQACR